MDRSNNMQTTSKFLLYFIILVEGFVSVAAEILIIRQLIPVAGTSVIVTSLIIGIYLLFLAAGYYRGGHFAADFLRILQRNFFVAALFIGIGLAFIFINQFFSLCTQFIAQNILIILSTYLLMIVAPMAYFLGQTIPITMNLMHDEQLVGKVGGKVLFLSTIGSFFGAVVTTLGMMEYLGVAWTVVINAIALLFLGWLLAVGTKQKIVWLILFLLVTTIVGIVNIGVEKALFVGTTNYANYQVMKNITLVGKHGDLVLINNSPSSFLQSDKKAFPYIEFIKKILFHDLHLQGKNILVLGAGGFTLSAEGADSNNITYVDIDPKIKNIVTKNFLAQVNGDFVAADARVFLPQLKTKYDVIIGDTYSNIFTIPPELLTVEYFASVKRALAPDGIAIFNMIINPWLHDAYSKRIDNTIRAVFPSCMAAPLDFVHSITNVIYVCKLGQENQDRQIYLDNKNPSAIDHFFKQN